MPFGTSIHIGWFTTPDAHRMLANVVEESLSVRVCFNQLNGCVEIEVFRAGCFVPRYTQLHAGGVREDSRVKEYLLTRTWRGNKKKAKHYWKDIHIPTPAALASSQR